MPIQRIFLLQVYSIAIAIAIMCYSLYLLCTFKFKKIKFVVDCFKIKPTNWNKQNNLKKSIWIHASSVGESLQSFPLVEILLKKYPEYNVVISTCSTSAKDIWLKEFGNQVTHVQFPWDFAWCARRFIKNFNIALALFIEADFWLNFLHTLRKKNIPVCLINGRMSKYSFNVWRKNAKGFIKVLLNYFNFLSASSQESKLYFEQLSGRQDIAFFGNLKSTPYKYRIDSNLLKKLQDSTQSRRVLLALSTHSGEELMLGIIHSRLKLFYPSLLTIIIPRHINRTVDVESTLASLNVLDAKSFWQNHLPQYLNQAKNTDSLPLNIQLSSETKGIIAKNTDILLVNEFKQVPMFCKVSELVYVGKSMFNKNKGGHNILEPLRMGKTLIAGSYMDNFQDIFTDALKLGLATQVTTPVELYQQLVILLSNHKILEDKTDKTKELAKSYTVNLESYLQVINKYLK